MTSVCYSGKNENEICVDATLKVHSLHFMLYFLETPRRAGAVFAALRRRSRPIGVVEPPDRTDYANRRYRHHRTVWFRRLGPAMKARAGCTSCVHTAGLPIVRTLHLYACLTLHSLQIFLHFSAYKSVDRYEKRLTYEKPDIL